MIKRSNKEKLLRSACCGVILSIVAAPATSHQSLAQPADNRFDGQELVDEGDEGITDDLSNAVLASLAQDGPVGDVARERGADVAGADCEALIDLLDTTPEEDLDDDTLFQSMNAWILKTLRLTMKGKTMPPTLGRKILRRRARRQLKTQIHRPLTLRLRQARIMAPR